MSKKPRASQPTSGSLPPPSSSSGTRAAARRQGSGTGGSGQPSFFERYRTLIIGGVLAAGVGVIILFLFAGATAAPYDCAALLTPGPAASAEPGATPRLGFPVNDMGATHVRGTTTYGFCPPASGPHWNDGSSPLARRLFEPDDRVSPGNWVHNLEHGYVVIAYKGDPGAEVMAGIQDVFDNAPQGPIAAQCGMPNKVLAVRFDDMSEPFALLAWDRVLLLSEWDTQTAMTFAEQWQESPQHPEPSC